MVWPFQNEVPSYNMVENEVWKGISHPTYNRNLDTLRIASVSRVLEAGRYIKVFRCRARSVDIWMLSRILAVLKSSVMLFDTYTIAMAEVNRA